MSDWLIVITVFGGMAAFVGITFLICYVIELIGHYNIYREAKNDADILLSYDEYAKYYSMANHKWLRYSYYAEYNVCDKKHTEYTVCFETWKDYKKYKKSMMQNSTDKKKIEFLKCMKTDIESYLSKVKEETQKEIENIQNSMPKAVDGKQDINKVFEEMYRTL